MSFDYKLLGRKLREARESLLVEPEEAAEYLQISKEEYLRIEAGEEQATGDQVVLLANRFRRDFRYFVTGDYPSAESQIQEMFRQNSSLSRQDRIAIQEFARLCEYQAFLEGLLDITYRPLPNYNQYPFGHTYYKRQGAEAAALERERLSLNQQPVDDPFKLMRDQGIKIFKRHLEDQNISGLYLKHPAAGHCVMVNYLDDIYRQNFSAIHEYCHALFDSEEEQQVSYYRHSSSVRREWRANSFAGNFLAPQERLKRDYSPVTSYDEWVQLVLTVAKRFGVSSQVVIIRFNEIDWIDDNLKQRLQRERKLVIKKSEKFDPEIPGSLSEGAKARLTKAIYYGLSWPFLQLCAEAYQRNEITYHKILEMLFLPAEEGIALLNEMLLFMEVSES